MRPSENMEKLIKKLRFNAGAETHDRILGNVLQALDATEKQKSGATAPNIRRIIMKSPITKLVAAATIIIAVLVGINQFGDSIEAVALGQVIEAMKKVNWMHVVGREKEGGSSEAWLSFESKINIKKNENDRITYTNYHENKRYMYDPAKQTIYVYDVSGENFALGTAGPLQLFDELLQMERDKGAKITRRKVEIWEAVTSKGNMTVEGKVFIDIEKGLPMAMQVKVTRNGKILQDSDVRFEYPDKGPEDIYELGVPKSAEIVDETQP
jgi:hypothetical protein